MQSLHRIILLVAAAVSLLLAAGTYLLFSGFGDHMMQKTAFSQGRIVASLTFSNMFQLMSQGWNREQIVNFTRGATDALAGSPLRIEFHRAEAVNRDYGEVAQPAPDTALAEALRTGRAKEIDLPSGGRYIQPLLASETCLGCHPRARKGEILGAITVHAKYDKFIDDTRKLLMIILLLMTPVPFLAAMAVVVYLDRRMQRFVGQIDAAMLASGSAAPDFSGVDPLCAELDGVLDRFKRLAGRSGAVPPAN